MHGRPRPPVGVPEDPEKVKASKQRLALFSRLCNEVLARRAARRYDAESLTLAAKLLEQNPEVYTVWNYRREALEATYKGENGSEAAEAAIGAELRLTEAALRKNPKSYAAWHQRRWLVQLGVVPLQGELALVTKLLAADPRNFHGWAYRRYVAGRADVAPEEEEQYATDCINANFSNYSAWHARTVLLPQIHAAQPTTRLSDLLAAGTTPPAPAPSLSGQVPAWALGQEFDLVEQATFTDPEDQSAWMYHRWLLSRSLALHAAARRTSSEAEVGEVLSAVCYGTELIAVLRKEVERCENLLLSEPDRTKCKWPMLTLARLHELLGSLEGTADGAASGGSGRQEVVQLYKELMGIDSLRKGYYQDALEGRAAVVTRPPAS